MSSPIGPGDGATTPLASPPPPPPPKSPTVAGSLSPSASMSAPMIPATPTSPNPSDTKEGKSKKPNPLTDLVDTEKAFVDQLTGIIRKIAAAWSRSNLPPKELDTMFRSIEGIYKANRGLHSKLKDISADPRSAGELGGLLINWIDDLKKPYELYCSKYSVGFDSWQPVQSNPKLGPILGQFSATTPAPSNDGIWTLDALFLLPRTRISYYLKLYKRLLKNTNNPLLFTAVETLNRLLDTFEARSSINVADGAIKPPTIPVETEDEVVIDMRKRSVNPPTTGNNSLRPAELDGKTGSETSSNHGSASGGERSSRESEATSMSRASTQTLSMPISDLERRLSVERTLDIFTMQPKAVKLQMTPPSLTFTREMRTSLDVLIRFTPRATGVEVVHREGHIFLLSDLFLICERMTPQERQLPGNEGFDMWLCYPPLAGKVLRASEVAGQDNALQVAIMRKEFLVLETITKEGRDSLISHFKECIELSGSLPPPSKQPPPPLPPFNAFPRLQSENSSVAPSPVVSQFVERTSGSLSPPGRRSMSPAINGNGLPSEPPPPAYQNRVDLPPFPNAGPPPNSGPANSMSPPNLRPSASAQPFSQGPSFAPSNIIPPARSTGFISGSGMESPMGPGPSFARPNGPYGAPMASNSMSNLPQQPMYPGANGGRPHQPYPPGGFPPPRPPSEPPMGPAIHKTPSQRSMASQYSQDGMRGPAPPLPHMPPQVYGMPANSFAGGLQASQARTMLPSQARAVSMAIPMEQEPSPPNSPLQMPQNLGPVTSTISAQMKCKVFLQQQHAQWKALGSAKLKLYRQEPTNVKQLVVEADNKEKSVLISTIVLTDGVERVGKTGVAIELSDKGTRTGIVYMIQLRNENSAGGLFDSLLAGSDRATR